MVQVEEVRSGAAKGFTATAVLAVDPQLTPKPVRIGPRGQRIRPPIPRLSGDLVIGPIHRGAGSVPAARIHCAIYLRDLFSRSARATLESHRRRQDHFRTEFGRHSRASAITARSISNAARNYGSMP
jgi:hypothetical protein